MSCDIFKKIYIIKYNELFLIFNFLDLNVFVICICILNSLEINVKATCLESGTGLLLTITSN